jgi:hypothetical protein
MPEQQDWSTGLDMSAARNLVKKISEASPKGNSELITGETLSAAVKP